MPNRIIHEKATASPTLDALSAEAERLFWRLTTQADDYGRFDGDPRVMASRCFPLRASQLKPSRVEAWRDELARAGAIGLYCVSGRLYGAFQNWTAYQRLRESKPKYPGPDQGEVYRPLEGQNPQSAASRGDSPQVAAYARAGVSRVVNENERRERESDMTASGGDTPPPAANAQPLPLFQIPESISKALDRAPRLFKIGKTKQLREPEWWQTQIRAYPGLDLGACVLKAESWLVSYPGKAARKRDAVAFLRNWFENTETWSA